MNKRGAAIVLESPNDFSVDSIVANISSSPPLLYSAIIESANKFEDVLEATAKRVGIEFKKLPSITLKTLIATGHQPVVYHPGLVQKETQAQLFAEQTKSIAINYVLDLDEQDCGVFYRPENSTAQLNRADPVSITARLGTGSGLAAAQVVETAPSQTTNFTSDNADKASKLYSVLRNTPLAIANTLVRRVCLNAQIYHVPLSLFLANPTVQKVLLDWVKNPLLPKIYNESLDQHRAQNKIKNAANPFPNLSSTELPFWIYNPSSHTRRILQSAEQLSAGEFLVPRGAMVSLFFRRHCCNLFIHGLGGKIYEPAVERIALALEKSETDSVLAPYLIVSANRYPFTGAIDRLESLEKVIALVRSGPSHVAELINQFQWSDEERLKLESLAIRKNKLIEKLQLEKARSGTNTREIGIDIKATDNEIRAVIEHSKNVLKIVSEYDRLSSNSDTLYRRDFAFWY